VDKLSISKLKSSKKENGKEDYSVSSLPFRNRSTTTPLSKLKKL